MFAVTIQYELLEEGTLPQFVCSTRERHGLTHACQLSRGKSVSIYTNSRYAFEVVHDFGMLERQRVPHFSWKPNQKWTPSKCCSLPILLPNGIAIIKIEVHTRKTEPEYPGNVLADFHAESASTQICNLNEFHNIDASQIINNLYERQNQAPEVEQQC